MSRKWPKYRDGSYQFENSETEPFSYTSPRYRKRFGSQSSIRSVTASALDTPSAPSPTAARTSGWPLAGGVPLVGVNVFVLVGGTSFPLSSVTSTPAAAVAKLSCINATAWSGWD